MAIQGDEEKGARRIQLRRRKKKCKREGKREKTVVELVGESMEESGCARQKERVFE